MPRGDVYFRGGGDLSRSALIFSGSKEGSRRRQPAWTMVTSDPSLLRATSGRRHPQPLSFPELTQEASSKNERQGSGGGAARSGAPAKTQPSKTRRGEPSAWCFTF